MSLRTKNVISVVVLAALAITVFFVAWKVVFFPPPGPYTVVAEFEDAAGVTKNSDVKIGGVPGGIVEDIELKQGSDTAIVTMKLDEGAFPIGAGAVADSRPVNLLGEKYIDMDAGDLSQPQDSGAMIPIERTSRPVELDDILNTLQPGIRARMRILINEAGISMMGRGSDFMEVLENLPPALDETEELVAGFSAENDTLESAIVQSDRVIDAFEREKGELQNLVDSATGTLEITADKRAELAATLRSAPGALRQLQTTLGELGTTATELEPMSRQVRAAAPPLVDALQELPAFAGDAEPALQAAIAVSPALTRLGIEGREPVRRLAPTAARLSEFTQRFQPTLDILEKDKGFQGILNVMNGWASAISRVDGVSHTFGTELVLDSTLIENAMSRYAPDASSRKKSSRSKPAAPPRAAEPERKADPAPRRELLPKIKLPKLPELPVPGEVKKTLGNVGGAVDQAIDGLTGRREQRGSEKGSTGKLLDYLMGP